jgi:hypothetical protein
MIFLWGNYNDAAPTALKKWGWWDIIPGRCLGLALAAPLGLGILPRLAHEALLFSLCAQQFGQRPNKTGQRPVPPLHKAS